MKEKESLKVQVHHALLEAIVRGEYRPNDIINEQTLVEKFGCSKSPVREALIALCNEGVLRNLPRFGYEVIRLTKEDISDILDFRLILEGGYLQKNAARITPEAILKLQELDTCCNQPSIDLWSHWHANTEFHLQLLSFTGNAYACYQLKKTMEILKRAYGQFYWDKWDSTYIPADMRYHARILDQIQKRNLKDALTCLKLDLEDFALS